MGFADPFYQSIAWVNCREAYKRKAGGICERCYKQGIITPGTDVHHVRPLTRDTIKDPRECLSFDNLMLLCSRCHHDIHAKAKRKESADRKRFVVEKNGAIKIVDAPHSSEENQAPV